MGQADGIMQISELILKNVIRISLCSTYPLFRHGGSMSRWQKCRLPLIKIRAMPLLTANLGGRCNFESKTAGCLLQDLQ